MGTALAVITWLSAGERRNVGSIDTLVENARRRIALTKAAPV